ncbi:hypothetical protein AAY473_024123 [Plecturocebus cupreus]
MCTVKEQTRWSQSTRKFTCTATSAFRVQAILLLRPPPNLPKCWEYSREPLCPASRHGFKNALLYRLKAWTPQIKSMCYNIELWSHSVAHAEVQWCNHGSLQPQLTGLRVSSCSVTQAGVQWHHHGSLQH